MPGDNINIDDNDDVINYHEKYEGNYVNDYDYNSFIKYLEEYQNDYLTVFKEEIENEKINDEEVFYKLKGEIQNKLNMIKYLNFDKIFNTYIKLFKYDKYLVIDFNSKKVFEERNY